ncbi:MAG: hypothetical protein QOJ22_579 [Thermoleophilaceae bacterium]|nr:hypothetical protein [Thermoleophilaceae bacterium]
MRLATAALAALALAAPPVQAADGEWLAGDLHVHTTYSHDTYGGPSDDNTGPEEAYTLGFSVGEQFQNAATRGLDFLAITDHNDIRSQTDPGFGAAGVAPLPGYENSLKGHAQMLGATMLYPNEDESATGVQTTADALRADGGLFQINHPADGSTDFPHDADWSYLYAVQPDTVEVWNISRIYQPPFPSASSNDDAVRYWEGWLDRGAKVTATGGSDNHWRSTFAAQGVGQPTTWVYASEPNAEGLLEGVRAGRTFISHQPPSAAGPRLFLEGEGVMVGGEVRPGAPLRVRVQGGSGTLLRIIATGSKPLGEQVPVTGPAFEHEFKAPAEPGWVRAELFDPDLAEQRNAACGESETTYCRNMLGVTAMTSAIYVRSAPGPAPPAVRAPRLNVRPKPCVRSRLLAHVRGPGIRHVRFFVDGRHRGRARVDRRGRWYLNRRLGLRPGPHRVRARVTFTDTRRTRRDLRAGFRVCKAR